MLGQHLRRLPNIKPTLDERVVPAGLTVPTLSHSKDSFEPEDAYLEAPRIT